MTASYARSATCFIRTSRCPSEHLEEPWEKDRYLLTSNLTGLEQYVPDLTIKRIADGSHWVIYEQPELVNKYIKEFIK